MTMVFYLQHDTDITFVEKFFFKISTHCTLSHLPTFSSVMVPANESAIQSTTRPAVVQTDGLLESNCNQIIIFT